MILNNKFHDGVALKELIKEKKNSPRELIIHSRELFEKTKKHNAIIFPMYDLALKECENITSDSAPFYGIPTFLKDLIALYKGLPTSSGSKALSDFIPQFDSEIVVRMKKAGLLICGKTNTPELGIKGTTEPISNGPTKNPWDNKRSPGGSSGGSATAVALGLAPFAHGNDGGGSLRIPAAHCGLFGFKATRGRFPLGPFFGELCDGAVCEGFISKSVRDMALLFDTIAGPEKGGAFILPTPKESYFSLQDKPPKKFKIGYSTTSPMGNKLHPDVLASMSHTIDLLKKCGHEVVEKSPKIDGELLAKNFIIHYATSNALTFNEITNARGRIFALKNTELETQILSLIGQTFTSVDYLLAQNYKHNLRFEFDLFFSEFDLFLTPTTATPPPLLGEHELTPMLKLLSQLVILFKAGKLLKISGVVDQVAKENLEKVPFTQLANLTGMPAISLPLYWTKENLPIGSMFHSAFGREDLLFQLAFELEKETPWIDKCPPILDRPF